MHMVTRSSVKNAVATLFRTIILFPSRSVFFTGFATIVLVASFCLYVLHWSLLTSAVVSMAILLILFL